MEKTSIVKNFPLDTNKANISKITLVDRYPETGYVLNAESEMVVYVLDGKVIFNEKENESVLEEGMVVLVKANQEYFWIPDPKVILLIFSTPPWNPEQQRIIK